MWQLFMNEANAYKTPSIQKNHLNISKQKKSFNKQSKLLNAMGMDSKLQTQFQNIQKVHLI